MQPKKLKRREFLRQSALTVAGVALAGCRPAPVELTTPTVTLTQDSGPTATKWVELGEATATPIPTSTPHPDLVEHLLSQMSTQEKIEQLHGVDWMNTADNARLGIPGFYVYDGPHGVRAEFEDETRATSFPVSIAMVATWDPDLMERVGEALGKEFLAKGRNQGLAPCTDVQRDPRNGRSAESGGEEPYLAGKINAATVRGIQSTQVIATIKHFAATNHQADRKSSDHTIDGRTLREFYGMPFRYAVQQGGTWSVMNAYNWINGQPSSANHELLTEILRGEWGYGYYVISDWESIYTGAANAINAGCDLEMPGHTQNIYRGELPGAIDDGTVSMDTLNNAVRRVLRAKRAAGIIGPESYPQDDPSDVDSPEHQALALEVAQKSLVLLKNEGNLLPLDPDSLNSVALIGPNANVAQMDGKGSSVVKPFYMITPREGIEDRAPGVSINYARGCDINSDKQDSFAEAVDAAQDPGVDVVIFVGGLDATQEGENVDRVGGSVQLPGRQQDLINQLAATGKPLIVVIESGGIAALESCIDNIDALVYAFYPGQEGGNAIADVLFGNVNPGGKLPVSMPSDDSQLPEWSDLDFTGDLVDGFGYRRYDALGTTPRYAFGHGLSYTTFEYGNLSITPLSANGDAVIRVGVDVSNTGARAGDEVAQLYLSYGNHPLPMPLKQLRGFRRITLAPGETRRVTFELGPEELLFWSPGDESFRVQAGSYTARVGGSLDDLPLDGAFQLNTSVLYDSATGETSPADPIGNRNS